MSVRHRSLSVLTIGNSFADSVAVFLPSVVESAGCRLVFDRANHDGCELHRHWSYIEMEEKDRNCRQYQNNSRTMEDILRKQPWDVVTIQQASHMSWDTDSYQPFATNIHNYVKTHAPDAEVVIQQTWAYRADDPRIMPGGAWGFDQDGMYQRLTNAYRKLAAELDLRIIPTGYAVQTARQNQPHKFVNYDPSLMDALIWPDLPPQAGSLSGTIFWRKDPETGEMKLNRDTIHLNARGQYLQACVWFAFLYGRKTSEITFIPAMIGNKDAAFLRVTAQKAIDGF